MTYANPAERRDLISGLRALADFLEGRPGDSRTIQRGRSCLPARGFRRGRPSRNRPHRRHDRRARRGRHRKE